jgi:serine/threonine-protein kinase
VPSSLALTTPPSRPGGPSVQTLGRYELLTPIGRGGMAVVWAARLRGTHGFSKMVAIKTMLPVLSKDPQFEAMFLAEAQMAAGIKHPNVCEILDLGEDRGTVYLVMESIDGEPLSRLEDVCIESRRIVPAGIAARIAAQAARGLHAAHELKTESGDPSAVIHRDVSPQNILVTCEGIAKIVDFGVAKAAVRQTPTTAAGIIKGKVDYLAPEQIEASEIDFRVDIFALGIVLYELLAGVRPFSGQTDLATLLAIASPERAPLLPGGDSSPPAFSPSLQAIVARALEKDPARRHGSMRELAVALEEFADEEGATLDAVGAFVT